VANATLQAALLVVVKPPAALQWEGESTTTMYFLVRLPQPFNRSELMVLS
jgi:hypothetical protein